MVESRVSQLHEPCHPDPMHRHVSLSSCEFPATFETRQHHGDKACSTRSGASLRDKPLSSLVQSFVSDADRLASLHVDNRARRAATAARVWDTWVYPRTYICFWSCFESLDRIEDHSKLGLCCLVVEVGICGYDIQALRVDDQLHARGADTLHEQAASTQPLHDWKSQVIIMHDIAKGGSTALFRNGERYEVAVQRRAPCGGGRRRTATAGF